MIGYETKDGSEHIYKDSLGTIVVGIYIDGTLIDASGSVQ